MCAAGDGPLLSVPTEIPLPPSDSAWDEHGRKYLKGLDNRADADGDDVVVGAGTSAVGGDGGGAGASVRSVGPAVDAEERERVVMDVLQRVRTVTKTRSGAELQRAFKQFDTNGDRQLDAKEMLAALAALGVRIDIAAAQAVVDTFDTNKNGYVDYGEFLYIFLNRREIVRKWQALSTEPVGTSTGQWPGTFSTVCGGREAPPMWFACCPILSCPPPVVT